jgi:hypothetical protein
LNRIWQGRPTIIATPKHISADIITFGELARFYVNAGDALSEFSE